MAIDYRTNRNPGPLVQMPGGSTFTRAGDGIGIGIDHKGRVIAGKPGEIVEWGKRRVENLMSESELDAAGWEANGVTPPPLASGTLNGKQAVVVTLQPGMVGYSGGRAGTEQGFSVIVGGRYTGSARVKLSRELVGDEAVVVTITGVAGFNAIDISASNSSLYAQENGHLHPIPRDVPIGASGLNKFFVFVASELASDVLVTVTEMQAEAVETSPMDPSEYVSNGALPAPYHGWNADGVAYFPTDEDGDPIPEATMNGMIIASGQTNVVRSASDLTQAAWTKRGSISVAAASDPVMGGQYTQVRGIGSASENDVYGGRVTGLDPGATFGLSCVMRAISPSGGIRVANSKGGPVGSWDVDLSLVGDGDVLTASHPAVTQQSAFTATPEGSLNLHLYALDGATLDFDVSMITLVEGTEPALPIPNPSDANPATRPTDSLMINVPAGLVYNVEAGYADGSRETIAKPSVGEGGITFTGADFSREAIAALQYWGLPFRAAITPRQRGATIRRIK